MPPRGALAQQLGLHWHVCGMKAQLLTVECVCLRGEKTLRQQQGRCQQWGQEGSPVLTEPCQASSLVKGSPQGRCRGIGAGSYRAMITNTGYF